MRTLILTNDFPPRPGGIQAYVHALACHQTPGSVVVYAPRWDGAAAFDAAQPFPVVRHPGSLMLPGPTVARRAREIIRSEGLGAVWFGAAAPLALLTPTLRRYGIERVVASTHGHEVGWAMLPGGRQALRRIGSDVDVVTFLAGYTRRRLAAALGPHPELMSLPSGVDPRTFHPEAGEAGREVRARYGLADRPVVVCVSRLVARKGQDVLIRALPGIRARVPGTALLVVGGGPDRDRLGRLARDHGVEADVLFAGTVPWEQLPAHYAAGDVFAMPCRTRRAGLEVEGLGLVYLEASATGLPVVAGNSGGAPDTVRDGETGYVLDGRDVAAVGRTVADLLADPERARQMGKRGRAWVESDWRWDVFAARLGAAFAAPAPGPTAAQDRLPSPGL